MIKLYKARSLLYRRQILQENIRWKALTRSTRLHAFAPLRPQYFRKNRQTFFAFFGKILQHLLIFEKISLNFAQSLMKCCRNFANSFENVEKLVKILIFLNFLTKCTEF